MIPYFFGWIGFAFLFLFVCLVLIRYRKKRELENNRRITSTGNPRPRDVYAVNMSSLGGDSHSPRYHGQEYTTPNQHLPVYRPPADDLTPPPPSYQDYKKDIRLPNSN
ncbi:hypothetical protein BJ944DRAFT_285590 [Cunninghamella echinulata]|nr:hypothetical protein BJ944DRAFT_285590 [Cunninghamella echinulata]